MYPSAMIQPAEPSMQITGGHGHAQRDLKTFSGMTPPLILPRNPPHADPGGHRHAQQRAGHQPALAGARGKPHPACLTPRGHGRGITGSRGSAAVCVPWCSGQSSSGGFAAQPAQVSLYFSEYSCCLLAGPGGGAGFDGLGGHRGRGAVPGLLCNYGLLPNGRRGVGAAPFRTAGGCVAQQASAVGM